MNNLGKTKKSGFRACRKALWQAAALILVSGVMAAGTNCLRSQSIPLIGSWSPEVRFVDDTGEKMTISLTRASRMFSENQALFIDARPAADFAEGHIRGAVSLPWEDVESRFIEIAATLEGKEALITYCDGENCLLSHDLALFLKDMGFENIYILVNGWSVWKQAGLPVEMGSPHIG